MSALTAGIIGLHYHTRPTLGSLSMKRVLNLRMREMEVPGLQVMNLEGRMAVMGEGLGGSH